MKRKISRYCGLCWLKSFPCMRKKLKISLRDEDEDSGSGDPPRLHGPLRLHDETSGSCLWQAKCSDKEFGGSLKGSLR